MMREPLLSSRMAADPGRVAAVLGPTNTGKTHYAVERMLAHGSGVMGFPLRLLAREIYDRIVLLRGAGAVALLTGEEQIGSDDARFVIATVEAMPIHRRFAFLAVDEIQLCADRERGHVFTDRLLHARGEVETLFLGSDTIRPLLKQLVPEALIITRPRFSILSHVGPVKLNRLPRRSAVVAFTAADVYTLAEVMRRQKGGAAVVLGALSPRTRNAQVALYQSGEVDHLVATDAIGMGLNMDLGHVAFAQLRKFDGRQDRRLTAAEIGQIAGRAGRHMADGTFGTTNGSGPLDERIVEAVEAHQFLPLKRLRWRNGQLDFTSLDALHESLDADPPAAGLIKVRDALDDRSLGMLAGREDIRARARGVAGVRLLWQVCQIPDFRRTLTDAHLQLLATVFRHLTSDAAVLPTDWVGSMIARLDRMDGDIDTLVGRIAHVRTWTYLSHRAGWFDDPRHWQGVARAVEDRLSDALHERLTQKFVDRRTAALLKSLRERGELSAEVDPSGEVVVDGHSVGRLEGFTFTFGASGLESQHRLFAGAARRAVARRLDRLAAELVKEADSAFTVVGSRIVWRGAAVATIRPGALRLRPDVAVTATDELTTKARLAVERRLEARLTRWLADRLGPLLALDTASRSEFLSAGSRGIAYRLVEAFGTLDAAEAAGLVRQLSAADRREVARFGVRLGVHHIFLPALLKPAAQEAVALLVALASGTVAHDTSVWQPAAGRVALRGEELPADHAALAALGFRRIGGLALRVDMVERVAAQLRRLARDEVLFALPGELISATGLARDEFRELLPGLGFRAAAPAEGEGSSTVIQIRRAKPRRRASAAHRKKRAQAGPGPSPFAVLARLKLAASV